MDIPVSRSDRIYYISQRQVAIERNKTGDVFCSRCFQATTGLVSHCCGKEIISREQALEQINLIRERLKIK